jgi:serine/threonine protein kinase
MAKKLTLPPTPPDTHLPHLHPGLVALIQKSLERNPDKRFQTAAELAWGLRRYKEASAATVLSEPVSAPERPPEPPRVQQAPRSRNRFLISLALIVAAAAVGVGLLYKSTNGEARHQVQPPDATPQMVATQEESQRRARHQQEARIALKERILDVYHKAKEGSERRDSQLAEIGRIQQLVNAGSLASASTAVDLMLAKPNLEPETRTSAEQIRQQIEELWNQQENIPSAFGQPDHKKKGSGRR